MAGNKHQRPGRPYRHARQLSAVLAIFLMASAEAVAQTVRQADTSGVTSELRMRGTVEDSDPNAIAATDIDAAGTQPPETLETVDDIETSSVQGPANSRVEALNPRVRPASAIETGDVNSAEEEPYLPVGFRAGTWQVFTRLEQAIGYATNTDYSSGGEPGAISQTDLSISMNSDWSRHRASIEALASVRKPLSGESDTVPEAGINGELELDLIDGVALGFGGGYRYTTESTSSNRLNDFVVERPGVHETRAEASLTRRGGKLEMSLRGSFERTQYEEAALLGGGALSQEDRNNNEYLTTARLTYGQSPAVKPFVEAEFGWRIRDQKLDRNGNARDSFLQGYRVGVSLDLTEKLVGEIAIGYLRESFDDPRLSPLSTPSFDADLTWSPRRGTEITLGASTSLDQSTSFGESGSVEQTLSLTAVRQVRHNLVFNAFGELEADGFSDGDELDLTWSAGLGLEYFVSRYLSFTADIEYERLDASDQSDSYDSTSILFGIALQR